MRPSWSRDCRLFIRCKSVVNHKINRSCRPLRLIHAMSCRERKRHHLLKWYLWRVSIARGTMDVTTQMMSTKGASSPKIYFGTPTRKKLCEESGNEGKCRRFLRNLKSLPLKHSVFSDDPYCCRESPDWSETVQTSATNSTRMAKIWQWNPGNEVRPPLWSVM